MAQEGKCTRFLTSPYARWGIILAATALGAAWLRQRDPEPIVRVTTPLPETVPFWYMVAAFPALGMLLADLLHLLSEEGLGKRSLELGGQIGVLTTISSLRLTLRLPISGHSLLFAYVILRRLFVRVPEQRSTPVELALVTALYAVTSYVKVVWWSDPVTVATGTVLGAGLAAVSWVVEKRIGKQISG